MAPTNRPLVSVVTPVYNGEKFLRACIESVIAQSYDNWEYVIINNRSTDGTLAIAREYAQRDARIRVHDNAEFVPVIDNFNVAMSQVSPRSRYCKPLMADDWLMPTCIERMVQAALARPEVGLVCTYAFDGSNALWTGMRADGAAAGDVSYVSGRQICRESLLTGRYVFGTPTSCLIRSDLIRPGVPFYDRENLHADHESCYALLRESDFAFVHQVLAFNRVHEESQTSRAQSMESLMLGNLTALLKHGPFFLNEAEYQRRRSERFDDYYRILAYHAVHLRERAFWRFHRTRLAQIGCRLEWARLMRLAAARLCRKLMSPLRALGWRWQ
jgi:glycosyltransferase involved in cell wall biosynthesis